MNTFGEVWEIPEYLCEIPHTSILTKSLERRLGRMDRRLYMRAFGRGYRSADFSLARRECLDVGWHSRGSAAIGLVVCLPENDRRQKTIVCPMARKETKN